MSRVDGQQRIRGLCETLALAQQGGRLAGVTRLADITHIDRIGVPVYQAIRPSSLALTVAQGKGLTRQAAMVSALLEAVETAVSEALPPPPLCRSLANFDTDTRALWSLAPRHRRALTMWPDEVRRWCVGRNLLTGRPAHLPFDLVSMDFTTAPLPDALPTSVGLASGNDADEAFAAAIAEVLEHDMTAAWQDLSARGRRAVRVDPASVDAPLAQALLRLLARRRFNVLLWDTGREHGVPGFQCAITDPGDPATPLPPGLGNGCHADREVALLRAILEAVQARATMIAGARDDLLEAHFGDGQQRAVELILSTLSIGPPPLAWADGAPAVSRGSRSDIDVLLAAVARRTPLPVIGMVLPELLPGIAVVRVMAPGLADEEREGPVSMPGPGDRVPVVPTWQRITRAPDPRRLPIVFAGPSLQTSMHGAIEFRPPAVAGDLAALLAEPPAAVGLVDGFFESAPSVWHKEIIDLAAHGIHVVGGASLGALRAAELQGFGMIGVGQIFAAYRDGVISRDDAVMVSHAPAALGYRALTVALVDAEFAIAATPMTDADRRDMLRVVRTIDFRRRDWPACLREFERRTGRAAPATANLLSTMPSVKATDAALVIATVLRLAAQPPSEPRPAPPPLTCFYADLISRRSSNLPTDHC